MEENQIAALVKLHVTKNLKRQRSRIAVQ